MFEERKEEVLEKKEAVRVVREHLQKGNKPRTKGAKGNKTSAQDFRRKSCVFRHLTVVQSFPFPFPDRDGKGSCVLLLFFASLQLCFSVANRDGFLLLFFASLQLCFSVANQK